MWVGEQLHMSLGRCFSTFSVIAGRAGRHQVFPGVRATHMPR